MPFAVGLLLCFALSYSNVNATSVYDKLLEQVDGQFDGASTQAAKYKLVSKPMNDEYLRKLPDAGDLDIDCEQLYSGVSRDPLTGKWSYDNKTHPLAIAISTANRRLTEKFLGVVPDVNAEELYVWGFRQPYNMAHLVLDPQFPPNKNSNSDLAALLEIIDLLAKMGANLNFIKTDCLYENPPLSAGHPSGRQISIASDLQARAILYGADPQLEGSSFHGLRLDAGSEIIRKAFSQLADCNNIAPTPHVRELLGAYKLIFLQRLDDLDI